MTALLSVTLVAAFNVTTPTFGAPPTVVAYEAPVEAAENSTETPREIPPLIRVFTYGAATARFAIGLAPIVAIEPTMDLLGYPEAHDNPTSRLMARLFGVRDIGLGVVALYGLRDRNTLRHAFLFNLATDLFDALMIAIPLAGDDGIDVAATRTLGFALTGAVLWTAAWFYTTYWKN